MVSKIFHVFFIQCWLWVSAVSHQDITWGSCWFVVGWKAIHKFSHSDLGIYWVVIYDSDVTWQLDCVFNIMFALTTRNHKDCITALLSDACHRHGQLCGKRLHGLIIDAFLKYNDRYFVSRCKCIYVIFDTCSWRFAWIYFIHYSIYKIIQKLYLRASVCWILYGKYIWTTRRRILILLLGIYKYIKLTKNSHLPFQNILPASILSALLSNVDPFDEIYFGLSARHWLIWYEQSRHNNIASNLPSETRNWNGMQYSIVCSKPTLQTVFLNAICLYFFYQS